MRKGLPREGRAASGVKEEDDALARSYHDTVLSGKFWQAVRRATNREGGGYLLPEDQCTKTGQPVAEVLREKHPDMRAPPWKTPRTQPSRNTRKYPIRYPSISRRMTSCRLHQSYLAQQMRWEQR